LGFAVIGSWYFLTQAVDTRAPYMIELAADSMIPFCELFVLPYVLWYIYVPGPMIWMFFVNRRDFLQTALYLFSGMTVCMIICTVWPSAIGFRPQVLPRDNILCEIVSLIYSADRPTNVFPSMHCYEAVAVCVAFLKAESLHPPKWLKAAMILTAALICLSTVFIKQHSAADMIAGVLLAVPMYFFAYRLVRIPRNI
jgi:membrane-associated phospholipid phosphatase